MPRRYQIPTRLQAEDTVLTIGGLSITMRQSLILFLGGCLALECWHWLHSLLHTAGLVGFVLCLILTAVPLLLALILALTRVRGRFLEQWSVILWRYGHLPKQVVWRMTSFQTPNHHQGGSV